MRKLAADDPVLGPFPFLGVAALPVGLAAVSFLYGHSFAKCPTFLQT